MKRIVLRALLLATVAALSETTLVAIANSGTVPPTARPKAIVNMWRANLRTAAVASPKRHFSNPPPAVFASRLRLAASRYHFAIVEVKILHPRQDAPLVVIEAKNKHAL